METTADNRHGDLEHMETIRPVMGITEWGLIVLLSILWGGSFFFVGVAVEEVTPLTVVWCRVALASAMLLAVVRLKREVMPSKPRIWGAFFVMGALNNVIPFSAIVLGCLVLGERLGWNAFAGMGLVFLGLLVIDSRLLGRFNRKTFRYRKI